MAKTTKEQKKKENKLKLKKNKNLKERKKFFKNIPSLTFYSSNIFYVSLFLPYPLILLDILLDIFS